MTDTPCSFVSMTYNLWGDHRLADREAALRALLEVRDPDLLAVQELTPVSREIIDTVLTGHERVRDGFPGWANQSNLWWRREQFELEEHGAEDVAIRAPDARLFWVRLRPSGSPAGSLLYATAHLTWPGHPDERDDDINPRVEQARRIVAALDRLAPRGACLFVADLNDYARPLWVLREAGLQDSFHALGQSSPVTHPVIPQTTPGTGWQAPDAAQKTIDWQFHRGPLVPRCSEVAEFFHEGRAPSDHKPVIVNYVMTDPT